MEENFKKWDNFIKDNKYKMLMFEIYYNLTCNDNFKSFTDEEKEIIISFIYNVYLKDESKIDLGYMCDEAIRLKNEILKDKIKTWEFLKEISKYYI